jgi:hypothetical protein
VEGGPMEIIATVIILGTLALLVIDAFDRS